MCEWNGSWFKILNLKNVSHKCIYLIITTKIPCTNPLQRFQHWNPTIIHFKDEDPELQCHQGDDSCKVAHSMLGQQTVNLGSLAPDPTGFTPPCLPSFQTRTPTSIPLHCPWHRIQSIGCCSPTHSIDHCCLYSTFEIKSAFLLCYICVLWLSS